jgi:hypothetical protein
VRVRVEVPDFSRVHVSQYMIQILQTLEFWTQYMTCHSTCTTVHVSSIEAINESLFVLDDTVFKGTPPLFLGKKFFKNRFFVYVL